MQIKNGGYYCLIPAVQFKNGDDLSKVFQKIAMVATRIPIDKILWIMRNNRLLGGTGNQVFNGNIKEFSYFY